MDKNPVDPDLFPIWKNTAISSVDLMVSKSPVWLLGLPPVMKAEHDGEGAGGQHLLVVVVVQAVSRCQSKSVPNLSEQGKNSWIS